MDENLAVIVVQIVSAALCLVLLRFMIKPYILTREVRYIGLPLGFGLLGVSYAFSVIIRVMPEIIELNLINILFRAFSFAFIGVSYYFSKKPVKGNKVWANITLSALIAGLIIIVTALVTFLHNSSAIFASYNPVISLAIIFILAYICINCFREYTEDPDSIILVTIAGYFLFGLSYATYVIGTYLNYSTNITHWTGLSLRIVALSTFLAIAYISFRKKKRV